nr:hypothetical protein [Tanacetum cinerariifolium]
MALPDQHQLKFSSHKDAKILMEAIEKRFRGNTDTKKVQKTLLKQQYKNFLDVNLKFLRSIPSEWKTHTLIWRNKAGLEEQSLDDLFNISAAANVSAVCAKMPMSSLPNVDSLSNAVIYSFFSSQSTSPWSPKNSRRNSATEPQRRTVPVEMSTSNALVSQCDRVGSYDWSYQAEEEPAKYALMAFSSFSSSSDNEHVETSIPATTPKPASLKYASSENGSTHTKEPCTQGHHKQYAPLTHTNPQKHMVPAALLTRSKPVSITTVRPVSVVVPKINVTRPRHANPIVTKSKSPIKRHITHSPSLKTSNSPPRVTTVKASVVSAAQGLQGKWEWRPKCPILDHVSQTTSVSMTLKRFDYNDALGRSKSGVIDSGCSRHMTRNMSYLFEFKELNGGYVAFGGNQNGGKISGKGKIKTCKLDFDDVYFVNELKFNLFSVSQMYDKKNSVLFTDTECLVLSHDITMSDESQVLLRVHREDNIGLPTKVFENDHTCVACKKGKQHKASCKTKPVSSVNQPLSRLHIDLFRPTIVKNLNKKSYCLIVTDDYSRFTWVFFLATKDETSLILKTFITGLENQLSLKVKVIRKDNKTKFKNHDLNQFCGMKEIKREFSVPRTPQQNGIAERKNRTLIEAARTMLADLHLPIPFWAKVINTACYVHNRVLVTKPRNKTPYELLHGRTPSIGFMRPFGCHVTILNTLDSLGKFKGKADEGFLVGYSVSSKAFRVFNSRTCIVQETLHVNFLKNKPTVVEKAGKEIDQQYVLFLVWSCGSTNPQNNDGDAAFDRKEHDFYVKKPESEASVSLSGYRDLSAEFEDCSDNSINEVNAAEADFNNLETSITVSLILTTRVYKDHPVSQIIGDLSSTTQTRRGTQEDKSSSQRSKNKKDERGIMVRNKARLVVKGHTHKEEINYKEVFALVARIEAIRFFLAYASFMGFMVYQMDVKSAFLYGTIEEKVYVCQSPGFEDPDHLDKVYKVVKALYSLHKDPRACHDKYVAKILRKFGLTEAKSASSPIDTEKPLLKDPAGEDVDVHTYRSMIGSLMYLTSSRPDIMFTVCACVRFQVTLKASHLHAVKRIFRYLKGKPHLGLWYPKDLPFDLVAYSDSDYAGASLDKKSTTRGCQFLGCRLISWECKKQIVVATSSTEAEYVAATSCCVNDITSLQALVDRKKVVVTEATIREALHLDDAAGVDYLPNEEIFVELVRMGYKKPSTKLTFYKAFFLSQ